VTRKGIFHRPPHAENGRRYWSAELGPRRQPKRSSTASRLMPVPCRTPSTCPAAAPGPMPVWGARPRGPRLPARWRAAPASRPVSPARPHREALNAGDVPLDVPAASCPGRRRPMRCFGIGNKHYRSLSCPISATVLVAAQCAEALGTAGPMMRWILILQPLEQPRRVVYRPVEEYGMFVLRHHHPSRIQVSRSRDDSTRSVYSQSSPLSSATSLR
jgi:hypothetical protein